MKTRIVLAALLLILGLGWNSCSKETSFEGNAYTLKLHFRPVANGDSMVFGTPYINPIGEEYTVSAFKFYVSHISLLEEQPEPVAYDRTGIFLVDAADPASKTLTVTLDGSRFTRIAFQLGVDSIYNVSGAQTDALDPGKGMFWTWNSGYIMAKLEGNSPLSHNPNQAITYHIGGFRGDEATQRTIVLDLPQQQSWTLDKQSLTEVYIDADIDKWFSAVHRLPILSVPATMTPGPLSVQYADNYAQMFRVDRILKTR